MVDEHFFACQVPPGSSVRESFGRWLDGFSSDGVQFVRKFVQCPRILVFQVPCYAFGPDGRLHKIFAPMELSDELRLDDRAGKKKFELCSVVMHNGVDAHNGHYICVFRAAGRWLLGDDTLIRGLSDEEICDFLINARMNGYDQATVAMLFYQQSM
jgi:ubiquitin carboxyl-terminal hydrolase 9/13